MPGTNSGGRNSAEVAGPCLSPWTYVAIVLGVVGLWTTAGSDLLSASSPPLQGQEICEKDQGGNVANYWETDCGNYEFETCEISDLGSLGSRAARCASRFAPVAHEMVPGLGLRKRQRRRWYTLP